MKFNNFTRFSKQSFEEDSLTIFLYAFIRLLKNRMGYSLVTLKQLVNDCGLSISSSKKVRIGLNKLLQKKLIKIYNNYDEESEVDIYQCSNNHQLIEGGHRNRPLGPKNRPSFATKRAVLCQKIDQKEQSSIGLSLLVFVYTFIRRLAGDYQDIR